MAKKNYIEVVVKVHCTWRDALKLRLGGIRLRERCENCKDYIDAGTPLYCGKCWNKYMGEDKNPKEVKK